MKNLISTAYIVRNYLNALLLLLAMLALLSLIGWLLLGPAGIVWFLPAGIVVFIGAMRISPRLILLMHGAQLLSPDDAPQLYAIVSRLSERAGIKNIPTLYYLPSRLMDVFTAGLNKNASIAISAGIVRQLDVPELTAVLAHEICHIRGNDLLVMMIASVIASLTGVMALTGSLLILIYVPLYIVMGERVPWVLLIVLLLAPSVSALIQLALSRSREFAADLAAVRLTGDALSLASALEKIEAYQWNWIERMFMPSRHVRVPLLLRTHPLVTDRIRRLKKLATQAE